MASPLVLSRRTSEAPGPGPLIPPSPSLSPSYSLASVTGEIPILLDPGFGSPSNAVLFPFSDSLTSLFPPRSVAGSVGTFGQPVRRDVGRLDSFNLRVSEKINAWQKGDTVSRPTSTSFCVPHDTHSSLSPNDIDALLDPGPTNSTFSTPTTASFPFSEDEEDLYHAEEGSVFTLSTYLASASVYGDDDCAGECTVHNTPRIVQSVRFDDHGHQGPGVCDNISPEYALDNQEHHKMPSGNAQCRTPRSRLALRPHGGLNVDDESSRMPRHGLRRKKSELDVPLSPTSTFILSPSASIYEPYGLDQRPHLHPVHVPRQRHSRAASAPSSPTTHPPDGRIYEDVHSSPFAILLSQPVFGKRIRTVSNSRTAVLPVSHGMCSRACSHSREIESTGEQPDNRKMTDAQQRSSASSFGNTPSTSTAPHWIRNACIELWIDQEGFRSIQPRFELIEYSEKTGSSPSGQALDVAEFTMRKRQTWHFHHGTLDSPPVLRRLTLNGDMNDYISRQATLTLKHNGVYAVESTEDKGKLAWKFEYLVTDRHHSGTGSMIEGEKRFTPLNFVCNPELLTAEHGKKVKLLQFVRKSVTPKLQSFKLPPMPAVNDPRITFDGPEPPTESRKIDRRTTTKFAPFAYSRSSLADKTCRPRSPVLMTDSTQLAAIDQRPLIREDGEVTLQVEAMGQEGRLRPRAQSVSDSHNSSSLPASQNPGDSCGALIRPGERIISPSVLRTLFPAHESPSLDSGGLFPPPRRRLVIQGRRRP